MVRLTHGCKLKSGQIPFCNTRMVEMLMRTRKWVCTPLVVLWTHRNTINVFHDGVCKPYRWLFFGDFLIFITNVLLWTSCINGTATASKMDFSPIPNIHYSILVERCNWSTNFAMAITLTYTHALPYSHIHCFTLVLLIRNLEIQKKEHSTL